MGMTTPSGGPASASQLAWRRAYTEISVTNDLDDSFHKIKKTIESQCSLLQKQTAVRVKTWLKKLSEEASNVVWKKNRNAYAKLLMEQLRAGRLEEPFDVMPPDSPLPTLPKSLLYSISSNSSNKSKQRIRHDHLSSPSDALDDYLGRHGLRVRISAPPQTSTTTTAISHTPRSLEYDNNVLEDDANNEDSPDLLAGTKMRLPPILAARSAGYHSHVTDAAWQPSKLELEARLGASRERQAELEWRLRQAEDQIRRQGHMLEHAMVLGNGPLPSHNRTLPQSTSTPSGHGQIPSNPPQHQQHQHSLHNVDASSVQKLQDASEIAELLNQVEAAIERGRQEVLLVGQSCGNDDNPLHNTSNTEHRKYKAASAVSNNEAQELLSLLDAFQQKTTALRTRLGSQVSQTLFNHNTTAAAAAAAATKISLPSNEEVYSPSYMSNIPSNNSNNTKTNGGYNYSRVSGGDVSTGVGPGLDWSTTSPTSPIDDVFSKVPGSSGDSGTKFDAEEESPLRVDDYFLPEQRLKMKKKEKTPGSMGEVEGATARFGKKIPAVRCPIGPTTRHTLKSAAAASAAQSKVQASSVVQRSSTPTRVTFGFSGKQPQTTAATATTPVTGSYKTVNNNRTHSAKHQETDASRWDECLQKTPVLPARDWESAISSLSQGIDGLRAKWTASVISSLSPLTTTAAAAGTGRESNSSPLAESIDLLYYERPRYYEYSNNSRESGDRTKLLMSPLLLSEEGTSWGGATPIEELKSKYSLENEDDNDDWNYSRLASDTGTHNKRVFVTPLSNIPGLNRYQQEF